MPSTPVLPFWVSDYLGDTRHLSVNEHGAYLLLLMAAWQTSDCSIPNDEKRLARMAACNLKQWRAVSEAVLGFWQLDEGRQKWTQKKLLREHQKATLKSEQARLSALAKYQKNNNTASANAERTQSERNATPSPSLNHNQKEETPTESPPNKDFDEAFAMWNELADRAGLSKAQRLTKTRKAALKVRLQECAGLDGWAEALARVERSNFLTGDNSRGWRADLDFLLQQSSFTKVMEGRYDNREPNTSASKQRAEEDADAQILAAIQEADRKNHDQQPRDDQQAARPPERDLQPAAPEDPAGRPGEPEVHGHAAGLPRCAEAVPTVGAGSGDQAGAGKPQVQDLAAAGRSPDMVHPGPAGVEAPAGAGEHTQDRGQARADQPGRPGADRLPATGAAAVHGNPDQGRDVAADAGGLQGQGPAKAGKWQQPPPIPAFLDRRKKNGAAPKDRAAGDEAQPGEGA